MRKRHRKKRLKRNLVKVITEYARVGPLQAKDIPRDVLAFIRRGGAIQIR